MLDLIRYYPFVFLMTVFFIGIIVFHLLELVAPVIKTYKPGWSRKGYIADICSLIVNGPGLSALETIAFTTLIIYIPSWFKLFEHWGWWAQFGVFFLVNDFLRYWFHRWYHEFNALWRVHRVHHTAVHMDAMSVFRFHILEAVLKNGLIFLPFRLLGLDPTIMAVYSAIDITKGFWHHANFRNRIGWLNYVFNSPEQHWWHHDTGDKGQHSNYGSVLSIWDILFGTFYYRPGEWPTEIGVKGIENFPTDYIGQMVSIVKTDESLMAKPGGAPAPAAPQSSHAAPAPSRGAAALEQYGS